MSKTRNLAILLFDDAELLDFSGPFEVFAVASRQTEPSAFRVFTVAEKPEAITARDGLSVNPRHTLTDCPKPELLLVPGGMGTRRELNNGPLIDWIARTAAQAELVMSVCTGALLLGKAGLLEGLETTTHHGAYRLLRKIVPTATVHENRRFVDNGKIVTSGGIAAGIDMSLHIVGRLMGPTAAAATAEHMEYTWDQE